MFLYNRFLKVYKSEETADEIIAELRAFNRFTCAEVTQKATPLQSHNRHS